jgi:acyl carrier protein
VEDAFTALLRPFLRFLGDQEITPSSSLNDLGLDSMQAIEVLFAVEDAYGIEFPDDRLSETTFATAGALWDAIQETRAEAGRK